MHHSKFFAPDWVAQTNIYEVNLRQYTAEGTFNAFARHLPRLHDMGVETLWFMPVTPISQDGRKGSLGSYYAAADYRSVNPEFGTLDDFKYLVQQAQTLGMKVIIDWVANHTGRDHTWAKEHSSFYILDEQGNFTERNGWSDVIDLDYGNPYMRQAMIEAMQFWVAECGIDGFRCDMAHLVTLDFWIEARTALDKVKPLFWLAETEDPTYHKAFDATYTWEWMHATTRFVKEGLSVATLDKVLYRYHDDFPPFSHRLYFTSNHDENSWNGTEYEKYGPAALPLAVFAATWNGIPLLYSGQELPNLQRLPFFDKAAIDWCSDCQLHHFYKTLFNMRRRDAVLRSGDKAEFTFRLNTNHDRVMMYLRTRGEQQVLVVLNFTGEAQAVSLADHRVMGRFTNVFTQHAVDIDKHKHLPLLPWGYLVLEKLQH